MTTRIFDAAETARLTPYALLVDALKTAATDYACLHTTPSCEIAQREWIVHVVVR